LNIISCFEDSHLEVSSSSCFTFSEFFPFERGRLAREGKGREKTSQKNKTRMKRGGAALVIKFCGGCKIVLLTIFVE